MRVLGDTMNFGDILRELIEERGISQREFAKQFHMAPSTLGNYINDATEPDYDTLRKFADYFHVTIDYLLDHHSNGSLDHSQDHLLEIYSNLKPEYRSLWMDMGKVLLQASDKRPDGQHEKG